MTTKPTAEVSVGDIINYVIESRDDLGIYNHQMREQLSKMLRSHTTALKGRMVEALEEERSRTTIDKIGYESVFSLGIKRAIEAITNIT